MSRDFKVYLEDILEAERRIANYLHDITFEQFSQDNLRRDAVLYNLQIIGEAAKHVSEEVRTQYPAIEWRKIAGLRDIIAHETLALS